VRPLRPLLAPLAVTALLGLAPASVPPLGFSLTTAGPERTYEERFLDIPSAQGALDHAAVLNAHPHYAGTPADLTIARYARDQFEAFGFDAHVESFRTRVDTPRQLVLEFYPDGVTRYVPRRTPHRDRKAPPGLDLREVGNPIDPATLDPAIGLPFNSGSGDGDVTAPLVYVSHGLPADYTTLTSAGVSVRGAIVLVRYGAAFRGQLAHWAQDRGAAGVILYSDPKDDGAGRGPTYPDGPWRPSGSVQRGSLGAGIKIPVLPISADNAGILLKSLRGVAGPDGWTGGLDAAYPLGRGPAKAHLVVKLNRTTMTLWNTIATLKGATGGESVILGAHRDAWVYGVGDNGAGTITMLEAARGLGYLAKSGWRPRRTITIALWDGEEIGLAGSAAYVKAHDIELKRGCVAYLNADENITGTRISADGVGSLRAAVVEAAEGVPDPANMHTSLRDRWNQQRAGVDYGDPGGGSDHESFLEGIGTPIAQFGFDGPYGVYHSSYDTLRYAQTWSDPGFVLHRTSAQIYGLMAMRLADADAVPYQFNGYVPALRNGLLALAARAKADGRTLDLARVRVALDTFDGVSRRADYAIARGGGPPAVTSLAAARAIDGIAYGTSGYASVAYPELNDAYAANDQHAIDIAIDRAEGYLRIASYYLR